MKGLTKRQREILDFIEAFIDKHHYSPSYREIQQHFSFSSLGTVYRHIQVLKRKGQISAEKKASRSMALAHEATKKETQGIVELPFIGLIAAGSPIEMFPRTQTLSVPNFLVHTPENTYILRAQGDSLNEELICDGDLLIVEARQEAHAGEIVVAIINQHETIVKRYFPEGQYVRLIGHIANHQPIILNHESLLIQGILVGLLRLYN